MPQIWSNRSLQALIDIRKETNDLKYSIYGVRKTAYWEHVAERLNNDYGYNFNYQQCRSRFNILVREFYNTVEYGNNVENLTRNTAGTIFFSDLSTRFWERPRDSIDEMRSLSERAQKRHRRRSQNRGRENANNNDGGRRGSDRSRIGSTENEGRESASTIVSDGDNDNGSGSESNPYQID